MSKEQFKEFVKNRPELADYVENDTMTWQKFYELFDLYGEDENVWKKYSKKSTKVTDIVNNLDVDTIQEHIESAQKALAFISELTTKGKEGVSNIIKPVVERPITKFFGD